MLFYLINSREILDGKEIKYAACWLENEIWDKKVQIYKVRKEIKEEKKEFTQKLDLLDCLPPTTTPPVLPPSQPEPAQAPQAPLPAQPIPPSYLSCTPPCTTHTLSYPSDFPNSPHPSSFSHASPHSCHPSSASHTE